MRPGVWRPAVELSPVEAQIVKRVRRARLFVMLRLRRHEVFDEQFQTELAGLYGQSVKGQPPVPPAQLALATILQAYTGVSDDEVIEATVMDRRWQLVLDCLDVQEPPFAKGTLQNFRNRLIKADLDRRLVERTVELAATRPVSCPYNATVRSTSRRSRPCSISRTRNIPSVAFENGAWAWSMQSNTNCQRRSITQASITSSSLAPV